jgi:hypothetical protein
MKNLFSINKTNDTNATELDATPYLAATVSDEVKAKLKGAFSIVEEQAAPREPSPEELALRGKGSRYWLICAGCLLVAVALFLGGGKLGIFEAVPALYAVNIGLLTVAIVFNVKAKRISRKQSEAYNDSLKLDFSEASARLVEAADEAARELGVPEGALTVDVFPFNYRIDGDKLLRVGKRGRYDNLAVMVFVKDKKLCLATSQELTAIPLSEITGYREYDDDFELDMWLKPEEPDSDKYKEFGVRKSGFLSHKGHGYFGLLIGQEEYEVLIPCYDFGGVRELLKRNGVIGE